MSRNRGGGTGGGSQGVASTGGTIKDSMGAQLSGRLVGTQAGRAPIMRASAQAVFTEKLRPRP